MNRSGTRRVPAGIVLALGLFVAAAGSMSCGSDSSSSTSTTPSTTTPAAPASPTPATLNVTGTVKDAVSNAPIASVAVAVQGKSATTAPDGTYNISGVTAGSASLTAQHQGHDNFTQAVTIAASGATTVNVSMTPSSAAALAGKWSGTWKNNTFGSTGTITGTVTVDSVAQTVTTNIDVNGSVFGAGDPPAENFSGTYNPSTGATFSGTSSFFGATTFTISSTGQVTGNMTKVPASNISRVDYTGTISGTTLSGTYTVTFTSGSTATGTVSMTKQ